MLSIPMKYRVSIALALLISAGGCSGESPADSGPPVEESGEPTDSLSEETESEEGAPAGEAGSESNASIALDPDDLALFEVIPSVGSIEGEIQSRSPGTASPPTPRCSSGTSMRDLFP